MKFESGKIAVLMVLATALLLSSVFSVSMAAEVDHVWGYDGYYDNEIEVDVEATLEASPGDTIDVTVIAEAKEDLNDVDMDIWISGTEDEGAETWESDSEGVINEDMDDGEDIDDDFEFDIPKTSDPGMILLWMSCDWEVEEEVDTDVYEWIKHGFEVAIPITYIPGAISVDEFEELQADYTELQDAYTGVVSERDMWINDFNSLQSDYDSLKATHDSLKATHDSLNSKHQTLQTSYQSLQADQDKLSSQFDSLESRFNSLDSEHKSLLDDYQDLESESEATIEQQQRQIQDLSNYRTYTYILAITTVIFVVTTIIFAVRRSET